MRTNRFRSGAIAGIAGLILGGAAIAPAVASPAASSEPPPPPASSAHVAAPALQGKFPSEWSFPNGDWVISTIRDDHDTRISMGTWSHRGDIRVVITDPSGQRTSHDFALVESESMVGWYQFSGSWRAHYPDAGPGQYKAVFTMKTSKGWQNICDKTLGFVVR